MSRRAAVESLLAALPGIVAVKPAGRELLARVAAEEERCEKSAFLPLRNEGVREVAGRQAAFALLKDRSFREPPAPTVYLVEPLPGEEAGGAGPEEQLPAGQLLEADGGRYRILGEEVLASRQPYGERTLFLAGSFVLFPERRASPGRPSFFLIPSLGFAELERRQAELGIRRVISISPSSSADVILREACGFPTDPAFATLLLGLDWASTARP